VLARVVVTTSDIDSRHSSLTFAIGDPAGTPARAQPSTSRAGLTAPPPRDHELDAAGSARESASLVPGATGFDSP